ncbi:putative P-type conjugative transfer protein TrbL, partial [Mitsuokella sp. oral taxon 131 str. W9106]
MELGAFFIGTGLWTAGSASHAAVTYYTPELKDSSKDISILGGFMNNYTEHVIAPGAKNILPYCTRLLVILAVVQATWELSIKFMSGDKLQYLINMTLKIGFYLFLMTNWISLMGALSEGFELLGIKASGGDAAANNIIGANCDRIVQLAIDCWAAIWQDVSFDSIGILLIMIIAMVAIVYCMFMTALEMFMARIEFYTMALLTLPLLAFGVMSKFSFLTEKAIGAMFNLAIKICAIAFIAAMAVPFIESFIQKLKETPGTMDDLGVLLQAVLACGMIYILTKKIPALVTGLLSGSPQLGGSSMVEMARGAA